MIPRLAGARRVIEIMKPPAPTDDGVMSLYDHLRELRYRVVASVLGILVTSLIAAIFYRPLIDVVMWPWYQGRAALLEAYPDAETTVVNVGIAAPFMLVLKVSLVAGLLLACPIWLWQLWRFIVPALLDKEKKYARWFLVTSIPLFLLGCSTGYLVLPKGIEVMLGFTPEGKGITNMLEINQFLQLELLLVLLFGVSFLLPVVLVMLNIAGVLKGEQLAKSRTYAIFGTFVFGAFATPSTDPFSMLALAVPMALMYLVAEVICKRNDKRKAKRLAAGGLLVTID